MAQLHEQVCAVVDHCPEAQRAAYGLGRDALFFFLREMAISEHGMSFACAFLDRTDGWRRMRRREAYALKALRGAPAMAEWTWSAMKGWDRTTHRLRSRRISREGFVLPQFAASPAEKESRVAL
jgi:hypothetical protein